MLQLSEARTKGSSVDMSCRAGKVNSLRRPRAEQRFDVCVIPNVSQTVLAVLLLRKGVLCMVETAVQLVAPTGPSCEVYLKMAGV